MNTEDMLKELASLLNSFFIHPKFLEELRTLLKTDLKGKESNVRLIVYINDENIPYFLCAFNERSGKNRTNYSTYTTVMKERINYFLGDDNYE